MKLPLEILILIISVIIRGYSAETDIIECEEMEIEVVIQETTIQLSWTQNSCALAYIINHFINDEAPVQTMLPDPIVNTDLERRTCSRNIVTVSIFKRAEGGDFTDASTNFIIGLDGDGEVDGLHFNEENERFEWQAPEYSLECEVEYEINFDNEIITDTTTTTNEFYEFPLYFCSANYITVTTIIGIEDRRGGSVISSRSVPVPDIIEVQNLRFNEEMSAFVWEAPERSQICNVEYRVDFENEVMQEEIITSDEFYPMTLLPCSNNNINVVTILGFDSSESGPVYASHVGAMTRQIPIHISTDPRENSAEIIWRIELEVGNLCIVETLRYEVVHVDTAVQNDFYGDFSEGDPLEFLLTPLEVDQLYQYRVCYVFSSSDTRICSSDVKFLTEPLSTPTITIETEVDQQHRIHWSQNYNSDFVTGHTLIQRPLGYNHFVPEHCPIPSEIIETFFEPGITSYTMEDARPSFTYALKIVTHFSDLGMTTASEESTITTVEGTPGDVDIRSRYEFVPSSLYDVSLEIEWDIPCDVNGEISRFSYVLNSELSSGLIGVCTDDILFSGSITDIEDNKETYSIIKPGVLPFFKYSIAVTTYLEENENTTEMELEDPPQPYSPIHTYWNL